MSKWKVGGPTREEVRAHAIRHPVLCCVTESGKPWPVAVGRWLHRNGYSVSVVMLYVDSYGVQRYRSPMSTSESDEWRPIGAHGDEIE